MKNGLITAGVVLLAGLLYFAAIGLKHTFSPKPPPISTPAQTIDLTQVQKDSLDAEWLKKFVIIRRGRSVSKSKTDTIYTESTDSTTIAGLYSLIEALSNQSEHQCPVYAQPQPVKDGYKFGMAFGIGNALTKHSTSLTVGPAIAGTKGAIQLSAGYHPWDADRWRVNLSYLRWFR